MMNKEKLDKVLQRYLDRYNLTIPEFEEISKMFDKNFENEKANMEVVYEVAEELIKNNEALITFMQELNDATDTKYKVNKLMADNREIESELKEERLKASKEYLISASDAVSNTRRNIEKCSSTLANIIDIAIRIGSDYCEKVDEIEEYIKIRDSERECV